jgi:hypothetical protein
LRKVSGVAVNMEPASHAPSQDNKLDPHEAPPRELKEFFKSWLLPHLPEEVIDFASVGMPRLDSIPQERYHEELRLFMMKRSSPKALRHKLSSEPVPGCLDFDASRNASQLQELTVPLSRNPEEAAVFLPDDLNASVYSSHKIPGRWITFISSFYFYDA